MEIFKPVVEHMKLQIRMNVATRQVELKVNSSHVGLAVLLTCKTCESTVDPGALQKAADFVKAFMLGFAVQVSGLVCLVFFLPNLIVAGRCCSLTLR